MSHKLADELMNRLVDPDATYMVVGTDEAVTNKVGREEWRQMVESAALAVAASDA